MRKGITSIFGAVVFALAATSLAPASIPDISVKSIDITRIPYLNTDYGWYTIRCDVGNASKEEGMVSVKLQAIDKYAYKRDNVQLWGHLEAGETSVLTPNTFTGYKTLQNIRKWEILQASLHQ